MKYKALTLAVVSAIGAGAAVQANAAFFEPWTVTGAESFTIHVGGSTAQDKGMILLMRRVCSAGTMTRVSGNNVSAMMCEANGGDSLPIALGTKMVFYKNSTGGSGNGVKPVSNNTTLPFVNLASLNQAQYQDTTVCTFSTVAATADFADYQNYACGTGVSNSNLAPDVGISDVEPSLLGWISGVDGTLTVSPGPQVLFGVPVSKNFRDALQTAQGKTPGSDSEANMPSLTKNQIASILNGGLIPVSRLSDNTGTALSTVGLGNATFNICRRAAGSGTLAAYNAYFMNSPCAKNVLAVSAATSAGNGAALLPAVTQRVMEYGSSPQVVGCLNAMHLANKYAVGMTGMEFAPGSAYASTGLAAPFDNDTGNWGWVKINGYAPDLLNTVQSKYDFLYEATYQYRAAGNTFGAALAGDAKTLADLVIATNGAATVIKELNNGFVQSSGVDSWYTGLLGKPGTPTAPSAAPAGVLTAAEVIANPVNTWTRTASGAPNSCQLPYVTKETGLDMLQ